MASMIAAAIDVVLGVQTELAIFVIAVCMHTILFGSYRFKPAQTPKKVSGPKGGGDGSSPSGRRSAGLQASVPGAAALVRAAKKLSVQGADRKAAAEELGSKARSVPEGEVCAALLVVLESAGKSAPPELLGAVRDVVRGRGLSLSPALAEALLKGCLATRSKQEFQEVLAEVEALGAVSPSIAVLALRASVEASDFDAALGHLHRLGGLVKGGACAAASPMPQQVVQQLVHLAMPREALPLLLRELASQGFLTASAFEAALVEGCSGSTAGRAAALLSELEGLASAHGVELTDKASAVLLRAAASAEDALRIFGNAVKRGSAGQDAMLAALDASTAHSSRALAESVLQHLPKTLTPELGAALLRSIAEGPLRGKDADADVLSAYERHASGVDVAADLGAGRLVAEAALRQKRPELLERLLRAAENPRRVALVKSFGSDHRLADATAVFRASPEKTACLYNAMMDACIECGDTGAAERIMDEAVAAGKADVVTHNTIIKQHLQAGQLRRARAVIETMRTAGGSCAPNIVTFNELIDATIRHSSEGVWVLIEEMKACKLQPTSITCSILLKSIQRNSRPIDVERTMAFVEEMGIAVDEILLSSACEACIRAGRADLLAKQLQRPRNVQVSSARTFGSVIRAYGFLNDVQGAWEAWRDLRRRQIVPTDITIGCMVEALVSNGDPESGYELIRELAADERTRHLLNAIVYCSVLKGFSHKRSFNRVWDIYDEMVKAKLQFSIVTYNAVIDACARSCQMARVQPLLEDMARQQIEPNIVTYSTILKGYCQEGRLNQAFELLETMKQSNDLRPDEITYNTLIDGCAQRGLYDQGMKLLEEMQRAGVQPSVFTLTVLVKLANRGKRPEKAFEIVEELSTKYRLQLNSHVYANLVHTCTAHGDLKRAVQVLERMGRQRVRPDVRTYTLLIRGLLEAGKLPEAAGLVRLACGARGALPPSLAGLAGAAADMRPRGGLPQELMAEALEAMSRSGAEHLAMQLCKDLRAVPGLKLDPKLSMSLTSRAIRSPSAF